MKSRIVNLSSILIVLFGLFGLLFLLGYLGCRETKEKEIVWEDVGNLVKIEILSRSFSGAAKTVVCTTKGTFLVWDYITISEFGSPVKISLDKKFLLVSEKQYKMYITE